MKYTSCSLQELNSFIEPYVLKASKVFLLTDEIVGQLWLSHIIAQCPAMATAEVLEVESSEKTKSIEVCAEIWKELIDQQADRHALLIALGGGIVCDVGGFIASVYKRGIHYINLPTTLVAMADAALGGKTAINLMGVKNCIGSFYPPQHTYILPEFLSTLDKRQMLSGFSELLKYGLIAEKALWTQLLKMTQPFDIEMLAPLVGKCAEIKLNITAADPTDLGQRNLLNFGHSIGHALEAFYNINCMEVTHGECVAMGMVVEAGIARHLRLCAEVACEEIERGINRFFDFTLFSIPVFSEIRNYLANDKKNINSRIKMVLPTEVGVATWGVEVPEHVVEEVYQNFRYKYLTR